jgi:hypothetical protein
MGMGAWKTINFKESKMDEAVTTSGFRVSVGVFDLRTSE